VKKQSGITLVELLVVVVIMGIITSIALPSYREYMIRANRVDAKAALLEIAAAQEEWYLQNNSYTTTLGSGGLNLSGISKYKNYTVAIESASATDYIASATAREGQASDEECPVFAIDALGRKFGGKKPISKANNDEDCWGLYGS